MVLIDMIDLINLLKRGPMGLKVQFSIKNVKSECYDSRPGQTTLKAHHYQISAYRVCCLQHFVVSKETHYPLD